MEHTIYNISSKKLVKISVCKKFIQNIESEGFFERGIDAERKIGE